MFHNENARLLSESAVFALWTWLGWLGAVRTLCRNAPCESIMPRRKQKSLTITTWLLWTVRSGFRCTVLGGMEHDAVFLREVATPLQEMGTVGAWVESVAGGVPQACLREDISAIPKGAMGAPGNFSLVSPVLSRFLAHFLPPLATIDAPSTDR